MRTKSPLREFAIAATVDTLEDLCRRRLAGDHFLDGIQFINFGLSPHDHISHCLRSLLKETGWRIFVHLIDVNLSTELDLAAIVKLKRLTRGLAVEWFEEDLGIWTWGKLSLGVHHLPPFLDEQSARATAVNVRKCSEVLDGPLCIENPPTYFTMGSMNMWDFMAQVADEADCGLVLDTGHMIGFDICNDRKSSPRGRAWRGWNRVQELHISGFYSLRVNGLEVWVDHHPEPIRGRQISWIAKTFPCLPSSAVLCLEMDGASEASLSEAKAALVREMVTV